MAQSGGQFVEQATHMVDLMRYMAGDVGKVYADMDRLTLSDIDGMDIPDVSSVNLVFRSGAIGHIDALCNQHEFRTETEILGRDFRIFLDWSTITISNRQGTVTYESRSDFHRKQDHAFIDANVGGDRRLIRSPYDDAVKSLEATLAANKSARMGLPVLL